MKGHSNWIWNFGMNPAERQSLTSSAMIKIDIKLPEIRRLGAEFILSQSPTLHHFSSTSVPSFHLFHSK